ncbi:MAG: biopolymer transporter ExbD [Verrucomicrobia bacterium]|nr:biopolymer transporter ExbD [Verrucomicrobiota bacterium]MCH8526916.1 biopolymer transporter ExbD [Kiritimatiellia bacterium]
MSRKRRAKAEAEIDVGAFADIAFLLIIFFILTTSFVRPLGQEVRIPQTETPENREVDDQTPSVNVTANLIRFGETEDSMADISLDALRDRLFQMNLMNAEDQDRMIVLEVADDVTYERYFQVVTLISDAGGIIAIVEEN